MNRFIMKLARTVAVAGVIAVLAATPAFADHDDDDWHHHHRRHGHHGEWYRPREHYYGYRTYERRYYEEPYVEYYSPRVYVPPPPVPSFGLSLVFPLHR